MDGEPEQIRIGRLRVEPSQQRGQRLRGQLCAPKIRQKAKEKQLSVEKKYCSAFFFAREQ